MKGDDGDESQNGGGVLKKEVRNRKQKEYKVQTWENVREKLFWVLGVKKYH